MPDPVNPVPELKWAGYGVGYVDCSPLSQAARAALLAELRGQLYGGVSSVSDRGRSVSFRSQAEIVAAIQGLNNEMAFCETGVWPAGSRGRLFHVPQVKGL